MFNQENFVEDEFFIYKNIGSKNKNKQYIIKDIFYSKKLLNDIEQSIYNSLQTDDEKYEYIKLKQNIFINECFISFYKKIDDKYSDDNYKKIKIGNIMGISANAVTQIQKKAFVKFGYRISKKALKTADITYDHMLFNQIVYKYKKHIHSLIDDALPKAKENYIN